MKKNKSRKKTLAEKEASLFDNAKLSKEAFNRGYDLGTTGIIKSLLNFIATSTIKPATKKGKTGRYVKFEETADIWMNELDKDCKDPFTAGYYDGWNKKRDFACQTDTLENNHPDYEVLGGKVGVHKTIKKKYKNLSNTIDIDDVKEKYGFGEGYYDYMASQLDNVEIENDEVIF